MAYATNELVTGVTTFSPGLRVIPTAIKPKTLAAVALAPIYAQFLPMAMNTATGFWVVWASGGANGTGTIGGFLDAATQTDATNEVLANMIMGGKIEFADIPIPSGQTEANLKTALRNGMRAKDFHITGLDGVY